MGNICFIRKISFEKSDVIMINYHLSIIICNVANGKYDLDGILFTFLLYLHYTKEHFFYKKKLNAIFCRL